MTDQRERFEAYIRSLPDFRDSLLWHEMMGNDETPYVYVQSEWLTWQAATAAAEADKWAAVRRCAEIVIGQEGIDYTFGGTTYQDGNAMLSAATDAIKAEFPDAFPVDPNAWAISRGLEST